MKVTWKGIFDRMAPEYSVEPQKLLVHFLRKANLLCEGVTILGYQYEQQGNFEKIEILSHDEEGAHVDLRLGVVATWRGVHLWSAINVRIAWDYTVQFPGRLTVPTQSRLAAAVREYNKTGNVRTKKDEPRPYVLPSKKSVWLRYAESPPTHLH